MKDPRPYLFDIELQRNWNSCVGQDLANYMEACWRRFKPNEAVEISPAFAWQMGKLMEKKGFHENVGLKHLTLIGGWNSTASAPRRSTHTQTTDGSQTLKHRSQH